MLSVKDLRIEGSLATPAFIGTTHPEFSWHMESGKENAFQKSYRICVASSRELLDSAPDLWDSGIIDSDAQRFIPYNGRPLEARQKFFFRITLWDTDGTQSSDDPVGEAEIALLSCEDWAGNWIYFDGNNPTVTGPCPYFRRDFTVRHGLRQARLYISAKGLFEASLNGMNVSEDRLVPGWTNFHKQIQYLAYDVTSFVKEGANAAGIILADGWYCGNISGRNRCRYGATHPELLAQLELAYTDGTVETIATNSSWFCTTGPILASDLYDGEFYDARLEMPGWNLPGFDAEDWRRACEGDSPENSPELVLKCCLPVREMAELKPVAVYHPHPDTTVWDFGQNFAGWVRVKVRGRRGQMYTLHFGEMLYPDNSLYNINYRDAIVTDRYVIRGASQYDVTEETWQPRFTFHGFRYVQIDGYQCTDQNPEKMEVTGIVLYSDMETTSSFSCGIPELNRLYQNVLWGQKSNFLEIPTDCPQRDERLGWTGDAQIFAKTACINMNVNAFFRKWLRDLRDEQNPNGAVSRIAPNVLESVDGAAAWADAMVICPWTVYWHFGDTRVLSENYDAMKAWINYMRNSSKNLIRQATPYGDWLALDKVKTPTELVGTAYFALDCRLISRIAAILGHHSEADYYSALEKLVIKAYRTAYLDETGMLNVKSQTACALSLAFGLLDEPQRKSVADLLESLIRENGDCLATGFVGTACLLQALSESGHLDCAFSLLLQTKYPSWLFPVLQGATTIWERWNSFTLENGFGDVRMNSFNHYSYGAVFAWMASSLGGISYAEAGGRKLRFDLSPNTTIGHADFSLETPYGTASSRWNLNNGNLTWEFTAPPNTSSEIILPRGFQNFTLNGKPISANVTASNGRFTLTGECI